MSGIFYLSLKLQEETNNVRFFPLFSDLKRFILKFCVAIMDTWLHLNLTFFKPWANQCTFLMEMFVLSYVNILCIYPRLYLQVGLPKASEPIWQTSILYSYIVLLICYWNYAFAWKSAFLQDSRQLFFGPRWLTWCQCYLKMHVVGEGPGAILWVLRHFLPLISRLLVAMGCHLCGRTESDTTEAT